VVTAGESVIVKREGDDRRAGQLTRVRTGQAIMRPDTSKTLRQDTLHRRVAEMALAKTVPMSLESLGHNTYPGFVELDGTTFNVVITLLEHLERQILVDPLITERGIYLMFEIQVIAPSATDMFSNSTFIWEHSDGRLSIEWTMT
jgi:hypothetical protein